MAEEKKELSLGREITKELAGDVCGLGAGVLVGGLALAAIDAIPGVGKVLKILLKAGAYGLEIATLFKVKEATGEYVDSIFDAVDAVKSVFGGDKAKTEGPMVEVDGAVK